MGIDLGYLWSGWVIVVAGFAMGAGILLAIVCSIAGSCVDVGKRREAPHQRTVPRRPRAGLQRSA